MGELEVLIVEDDTSIRESVAELLAMSGFQPLQARTGRDALRFLRARERQPAVILLDMVMPDMSGWEFRAEQLVDPVLAGIPVVVMSGAIGARDVPGQAHLAKPFGAEQLLRTVARVARVRLT